MTLAFEQIPLAIALRDDATFSNYFVAGNQFLVEQITNQFPCGERYIYLHGASGSGCTHLLHAACHNAGKLGKSVVYLPLKELSRYSPQDLFDGLESLSLVCIDDIQCIAGNDEWEEALFHLYNRLDNNGVKLLLAANCSVRELAVTLQDLKSRLSWGMVCQISPLDDQQTIEALQFRASRRGLVMTSEVAQFIFHRCQRKTEALIAILNDLDAASLKEQRRLTIPFVKTVLSW